MAAPYAAALFLLLPAGLSFCSEMAVFRKLCVNLWSCLCGVPMYAFAQDLDFLDLTKNSLFPIQKRARFLTGRFD